MGGNAQQWPTEVRVAIIAGGATVLAALITGGIAVVSSTDSSGDQKIVQDATKSSVQPNGNPTLSTAGAPTFSQEPGPGEDSVTSGDPDQSQPTPTDSLLKTKRYLLTYDKTLEIEKGFLIIKLDMPFVNIVSDYGTCVFGSNNSDPQFIRAKEPQTWYKVLVVRDDLTEADLRIQTIRRASPPDRICE